MDPSRTGTSADVPLLSQQNSPTRENNQWMIWRAVFNVSTTIIGAGIMSIPATLKVLGVIPAFMLIVLVAILVEITVNFMLRATYAGQSTTYAGLMKENFGKTGSLAVQICVMITTLGCLIMYLIIIGDVFSGKGEHLGILQEWFGIHWWNSRYLSILFTVLFVVLPLVLYRRVESLWFSSAVAIILAIVFVGICTVMAFIAIAKGQIVRPRMLPELNSTKSFFNLFTAIPVIVTAFAFHFNVHPIGIELGKPGAMTTAVKISLVICAAIYFSIGIFGYLLFGDSINADILVNFGMSSGSVAISPILNDVVRLSYALHLMLVFPLLNFSLRANIDELIFPKKEHLSTDTKRFMYLTLILLALSYLVAIAIPSIWYIYQFMGSTSNACLAFIFPGAIALRDVHGLSSRKDKIIAVVMIVLAAVTSIIAIAANIYDLIGNSS
ncbi:amino acid transporter AVT6C isoform X1 [Nicotiana tabacum]|uniref:Amino acid transporter AVT6C isoform X1 n=2 Tax=Nicotiana TaxID=4085 RepID=A0A1S4A4N0_TOBAC|nr:PREDICTED: probable sodium-coupled neutral amino acid transporter 6 isoform X1 [Nicotiana sylvestris]XP_016471526.1 PREDICTED: probable sodium-coupled neutral amino acid transporter 6 isoform X1 [Nicotiana tabacum]